jgi:hypothetical protein
MRLRFQTVPADSRGGLAQPCLLLLLTILVLPALTGCRSPYVEADIRNASGQPISLLEVDYPSASFGTESLAANAVYHYRFDIIGSGPTKVLWTDASKKDHNVPGPNLQQGQHGTLLITISASGATWSAHLQP